MGEHGDQLERCKQISHIVSDLAMPVVLAVIGFFVQRSLSVSSDGMARIRKGKGSMSTTKFQGLAGYVTYIFGGVGGRGCEASSYLDW